MNTFLFMISTSTPPRVCHLLSFLACLIHVSVSGNFIYQNYRQALEKISIDSVKLGVLSTKLRVTSEDYEGYLMSEREYLQNLRTEPPEVGQTVDYMEHLSKLYEYKCVYLFIFRVISDLSGIQGCK